MRRQYIYTIVIGVLLLGIGSTLWYENQTHQDEIVPAPSGYATEKGAEGPLVEKAPQIPAKKPAASCTTATIAIGTASYRPCADGVITVLDAMRSLATEGLTFSGKEHTGLGFFVESINGVKAETGMYWSLYKNGEYSEFGASSAKVSPGDAFEWKLEKSY